MSYTKTLQDQLAEFDKKFKCIQGDCDGTGHIPEQISEDEWTSHQCQFHAEYLFPIRNVLTSFAEKIAQSVREETIETARAVILQAIHSVEDFRSHQDPDDLYMELQDILKSVEDTPDKKPE